MSPRSLLNNLFSVVHSGHSRQLVGGAVEPDIRNSVRAVRGGQHGKRARTLIERICFAHEAPSNSVFLAAAGYKSASDIVHVFVRRRRSPARPLHFRPWSLHSPSLRLFLRWARPVSLYCVRAQAHADHCEQRRPRRRRGVCSLVRSYSVRAGSSTPATSIPRAKRGARRW